MDGTGERDQTVDRLLRQSLRTPARGGVTDACPDAETLAAWTDGGLSGGALEDMQRHVADCARCQDLAGTLARIHRSVPQPEPVRTPRRWLAWLVPLSAAAAAVALWFAVPGNLSKPAGGSELQRVSQAPPQGRVQSQGQAVQPALGEPAAPPPVGRREEPQPAAAPQAPQAAGAVEARTQFEAPPQQPAASERAAKETAENDPAKDKIEAVGAQAAPGAAVSSPQPAAAQLAERSDAARSAMRAAAVSKAVAPNILSPDPAVRWRILGSAVQHSSDGGSTWETVSIGLTAELTAGAAPATTVCWLVGRNGMVLLTTDGHTWRRVPFPEMTDLSAVRAVDAGGRVASVSTADGRMFVTTDAGVTWVAR